jgi:hypothetical protein
LSPSGSLAIVRGAAKKSCSHWNYHWQENGVKPVSVRFNCSYFSRRTFPQLSFKTPEYFVGKATLKDYFNHSENADFLMFAHSFSKFYSSPFDAAQLSDSKRFHPVDDLHGV